jgi:hypothetical protein
MNGVNMKTALRPLLNSFRNQTKNAFSAENLNITPLAKVGAVLLAGIYTVSHLTPNETKNSLASTYISLFHRFIDPTLISSNDAREAVWTSYKAGLNVFATSPLFYSLYHLIHRSGLPKRHHIPQSLLRGFTGTAATIPAVFIMYGTAAVALPAIRAQYMKHGYTKEEAKKLSEGTVFLGLAAPLEFAVEAAGCGVKPSQMLSRLAPVATALITVRLASGVLVQYRALNSEIDDPVRQYTDLGKTVLGTSVAQHGLNGCMRAMSDGTGGKGYLKYLTTGDTLGKGTRITSLRQMGGTLLQRTAFGFAWNERSHRTVERPSWAQEMPQQERVIESD